MTTAWSLFKMPSSMMARRISGLTAVTTASRTTTIMKNTRVRR